MTKLHSNEHALSAINRREKPGAYKNRRMGMAIGATALVVAGMGVAGRADQEAAQLTEQSNQEILDRAEQAGLMSGENMKAEIDDAIAVVRGENGEIIYVDPVTNEPVPAPDEPKG